MAGRETEEQSNHGGPVKMGPSRGSNFKTTVAHASFPEKLKAKQVKRTERCIRRPCFYNNLEFKSFKGIVFPDKGIYGCLISFASALLRVNAAVAVSRPRR